MSNQLIITFFLDSKSSIHLGDPCGCASQTCRVVMGVEVDSVPVAVLLWVR